MVKYASILATNNHFFSTLPSQKPLTAVFLGATNGIGLGALRAFAKHTSGTATTIYIVGRSQSRLSSLQTEISALNPSATTIPIQASDLTHLPTTLAAATQIASHIEASSKTTTPTLDFLIMSPGYVSLQREENSSGLDRVQTVRFYSRMLFLQTLAPFLRNSPHARVVTVLGAGLEGQLWADDLGLAKNYSLPNAAGAAGSMTTMFLEEFAKKEGNEGISSVHLYPGLVGGTGLEIMGLPGWAKVLVDWIVAPLMMGFGYGVEEAGERVLYAAVNGGFKRGGGESEGLVLLKGDSSVVLGDKILGKLREEGFGDKVWEHTVRVFEGVERV